MYAVVIAIACDFMDVCIGGKLGHEQLAANVQQISGIECKSNMQMRISDIRALITTALAMQPWIFGEISLYHIRAFAACRVQSTNLKI